MQDGVNFWLHISSVQLIQISHPQPPELQNRRRLLERRTYRRHRGEKNSISDTHNPVAHRLVRRNQRVCFQRPRFLL
jgi:hypothetical protein